MDRFGTPQVGAYPSLANAAERVTAFLRVVYAWMAVGLTVTALVAWIVAGSDQLLYTIAANRLLFWGLMIPQRGIVIFLSARVHTHSPGTATGLLLLYSGLTGLTMSFVLRVYTGESVATTFFVTAGTFGAQTCSFSRANSSESNAWKLERTCAAKASCSSQSSMSFIATPARSRAIGAA